MAPQVEDATNLDALPDRIAATLTDQTIFITGGTGFVGKVLIEKILRKNFDVREILLLIRPKKGIAASERLDKMLENEIFDLVSSMRGGRQGLKSKLRVVSGDVSLPDLGLSDDDRQYIIKNVQIVVHSAATVRFDETLKRSILFNTRGTKLMLELAKECVNLRVFVYVSTAYCHPEVKLLEEKPYPPPADPHKIIAAAEICDEESFESIARQIMPDYIPNTYVFSKALAEELAVQAMNSGLPIGILRPSIVIPILVEPIPGWTDNINGPTGLLIAAGKGVLRSMYGRGDCYADFVPVDALASGILIGIWDYLGTRTATLANCISSAELKVTWDEMITVGREIILNEIPLGGAAWYPGGSMTSSRLYHNFRRVFFHWLPAILVDTILFLLRIEPVLIRVQRRIGKGCEMFYYYTSEQWDFKSETVQIMRKKLNARELKEYKIDTHDLDVRKYFRDCILSARRYMLKQPDDTLPAARRHMNVLYVIDTAFKTIFFVFLLWYIFKNYLTTTSLQIKEIN